MPILQWLLLPGLANTDLLNFIRSVVAQLHRRVRLCNSKDYSRPGFPVLHHLQEVAQTHVYWVNEAIQLSHPFLPPSPLPSIFPSTKVFSNELALCIRWPQDWSFSFSISPSNEYSGLISFRIDWFDLLTVQGTQESSPAPQFESINSSVFSLLCGPTPTPVHDYWKNHSFDEMGLSWQSDIFAFKYAV